MAGSERPAQLTTAAPRVSSEPQPARVAVVIPCFNDGRTLLDTLRSVEEPEPVEIVVVDDCSTDAGTRATLEQLRSEGVSVLRHEVNRGLAESRNTGVAATRAAYVFPLDADDLAVAGTLSRMADRLDTDPDADVCYGDYEEFGPYTLIRAVAPAIDPFRIAYANEYAVFALFRRSLLQEVGGWCTVGVGYEDWDLWMTLAERGARGHFMGPGVITFRKRLHGERMDRRAKRVHGDLYRTLRGRHPLLFSNLRAYRRASDLSMRRKLLYPFVYGGRRRFRVERHLKRLLDRSGVWTLRR